ncbi:MAG: DUF2281 domain-containing protein [Anaerolineae bacterium]|nr:DUF2281 domain-containing protein [Anaerolineae bacterium]
MFQITIKDAKIKLDDLIHAAENGEDILIVMDDEMKLLIEVKSARPHPQYGSAEGLFEMSDDFDAPLEAFKDYMP